MTIDEAVEILTIHNDHNPNYTDAQRGQAHELGIEALKAIKCGRQGLRTEFFTSLLGETEE